MSMDPEATKEVLLSIERQVVKVRNIVGKSLWVGDTALDDLYARLEVIEHRLASLAKAQSI